jgi:hypothetical protein
MKFIKDYAPDLNSTRFYHTVYLWFIRSTDRSEIIRTESYCPISKYCLALYLFLWLVYGSRLSKSTRKQIQTKMNLWKVLQRHSRPSLHAMLRKTTDTNWLVSFAMLPSQKTWRYSHVFIDSRSWTIMCIICLGMNQPWPMLNSMMSGNVICKTIGMSYNEVTDMLACFHHNHWLLVTVSLWRQAMSPC